MILLFAVGCGDEPAPPPPANPNGQVAATVASFAVTTHPDGVETVHTIAFHEGRVRFGDDRNVWRLIDLESEVVTQVDEIEKTVQQVSFDTILRRIREGASGRTDLPVAAVAPSDETQEFGGFQATKYTLSAGRALEREIWLSQRPLFHSNLFLLELATSPIADEDLPALRELIELVAKTGGYPVMDRSAMRFDEVDYRVERKLVAVADQDVPASWFRLPEWAATRLRESLADRPPDGSPRSDRSAPAAGSRPSE